MSQDTILFYRFLLTRFQQIREQLGDLELSKMKWYNDIFASVQQVVGEEKIFPDHAMLFFLQYVCKTIEQRGKDITESMTKVPVQIEKKRRKLKALMELHQQLKKTIEDYEQIMKEA